MSTITKQLHALLEDEKEFFANASNFSAFIFQNFEDLNWAGFYLYEKEELLLGPFQGKPACIRIAPGKGVCGTAFDRKETVVVDDVHKFPGHIACDGASKSEIVIPVIFEEKAAGVLDIDSPLKNRFSNKDKEILEELLDLFIGQTDIKRMIEYYQK
jgi:GAF domain-containing protein